MKDYELKIGSVVKSLKGRDCGKYFLVSNLLGDFASIVDGNLHMMGKPKKKNIKHLQPNGEVLTLIAQKLQEGKKVFDSEVNKALRSFNENINNGESK